MPSYLCKLEHKGQAYYLEWSTIVDAPTTYGMSLEKLRKFVEEERGRYGIEELEKRLKRVEQKGTSAHDNYITVDFLIAGNRAGEGNRKLSKKDIIEKYCLNRPK